MAGKHRPDSRSDWKVEDYNSITQERAAWMLEWKHDRPLATTTYRVCIKALREHFEIGKTAAEQAMACYYAMMREMMADPAWKERIQARFLKIHEQAYAEKQYGAASSALAEFRDMAGFRPVQESKITGTVSIESAHVNALKLTQAQRKARIKELENKKNGGDNG